MADWYDISFAVPKVATLSDRELQNVFYDRDGTWSAAIRAARTKFGVDKLDLEENWASCDPDWTCPVCSRPKSELLRVSSKGVLLARLENHHDHLTDALSDRLAAKLGPQWRAAIGPESEHIEKLGSQLVARFERTRTCIDCNGADGTVKSRHRDIPRYFSFRPSEIREFVTPRPNAEHQIDYKRANDLFLQAREDFERRFLLMESLVALALAGSMTREAGNLPPAWLGGSTAITRYLHGWFSRGCADADMLRGELREFEARSLSRDGTASNPKKKKAAITRPTDAEIAAYDGGGAAELWGAAPAEWRCPACGRDRGDILRRSKNPKRRWAGKLVRHTEYILMAAADTEEFDLDPMVDRHEHHLICLDCATILPGVKGRSSEISASSAIFQFRDMIAVATATPNQSHEVDWEAAAERARASLAFAKVVARYTAHLHFVISCRARYRIFLDRRAGDRQRAWADLRAFYAVDGGDDDIDETLEWLLMEAKRIGIEDPYRRRDGADPVVSTV